MNQIRHQVERIVREENPEWKIHDFRMVRGQTHTNLIFDLVIQPEELVHVGEIENRMKEKIHKMDPHFYAVVTVEQSFI